MLGEGGEEEGGEGERGWILLMRVCLSVSVVFERTYSYAKLGAPVTCALLWRRGGEDRVREVFHK